MLLHCFLYKGYKIHADGKEDLVIQEECPNNEFPDDDMILDYLTFHELDRLEVVRSYRAV